MPDAPYAVLLVAYGAPGSLDEVGPYLQEVRGGRATPPEVVSDLKARYAAIGGASPLLERTLQQAEALTTALGGATPVFVGMRHWHPYIKDVLSRAALADVRRVVALAMAPHFSQASIGPYQKAIEEARGPIEVAFVREWHHHPRFLDAVTERIREGLANVPAELRPTVPIVFTAHSLPERVVPEGDPYREQLRASVHGVMIRLGPAEHAFAFQSVGQSEEPWLKPDASEVISQLAAKGTKQVLICPIGFVADHLEVLYDVDIALVQEAARLGMQLQRAPSLNASPLLIQALADLVRSTARTRGWGA